MAEPEQTTPPKDVCSMRIVFPVESDEQAVSIKKAISNILADIPNAFIAFSLSTPPTSKEPPKFTPQL